MRRALLTGAATAALLLGMPATGTGQARADQLAQAPQRHAIALPAQSLVDAIAALSAQTGTPVVYTEPSVAGRQAPALSGSFTAEEALDRLLAGSGLQSAYTASGALTIAKAPEDTGVLRLAPLQVYGAKTTTSLDDTLASVGIVTEQEIEKRQLGSFREAFRTMGNVMDSDWNDAGFVIRGVNSEGLTPGGAPLASVYVDGAQQTVQGARRGARGLWDVQQIEVYRGPQSTLSGRAALAGAIYVKTKDPIFEREAKVQSTVGTDSTVGGAFMANTPVLDDQVALRISGEYATSESDINYPDYESFDRYDDFAEDEYYQLRGKLLVQPKSMPDTSGLLTYSFSHDSPNIRDVAGPGLGFDYGDKRGDFNLPVFSEVRTAETHNLSFELTHDVNSMLTFTSLTTYSATDLNRPSVNEGTAGETNITRGTQEQYVATQEFRANYAAGRWAGVLGAYLAKEESDVGYQRPDYFGRSDVSEGSSETFNAALFGEATYEFVPTWKVLAGGRVDYTDETNDNFFSRNGTTTTDQSTSFDETVFLPKFGLIKDLTPDHTLGFTVQQGFRSGGAGVQSSTGAAYTFDAEKAWTYEASYKGTFLDGRLRTSANVFFMDWSDQQVEVQEDPADFNSSRVTNAASSTTKGFELEGTYLFTPGFSTFASIGYVDTEFEEFEDVSLGDLSGMPFPEAPEWNLAIGGFYEHKSGFFLGADAKYVSEYLSRLDFAPHEYVDSYWVANAQMGYQTGGLRLTVFAENLFDEEYFVYESKDTSGQSVAATLGAGRVVGVTASLKF
ncbi:MAG: TonB-dependent receptor [Thalassobaculaceae bacterium]|nr:TonB-dependent receptor [Thalassobaculaceae bacterium]